LAPPPAPRGGRVHDGFYLRLGLGFGGVWGSANEPDADDEDRVDFNGIGAFGELAMGGTVAPGLVIGGGSYSAIIPAPTYERVDDGVSVTGGGVTAGLLGPMLDWYWDPTNGFHAQGALGISTVAAAEGEDESTTIGGREVTLSMPGDDYAGTGFGLMLGVGYETWIGDEWSFGGLLRLVYLSAEISSTEDDDDKLDVHGFTLGALATLTYH
ncbi:MAG: hypothetical protein M3020_28995, partial [Myxococcota bacterium]|nr:hypothetical protein [Myxococcota bacterium]